MRRSAAALVAALVHVTGCGAAPEARPSAPAATARPAAPALDCEVLRPVLGGTARVVHTLESTGVAPPGWWQQSSSLIDRASASAAALGREHAGAARELGEIEVSLGTLARSTRALSAGPGDRAAGNEALGANGATPDGARAALDRDAQAARALVDRLGTRCGMTPQSLYRTVGRLPTETIEAVVRRGYPEMRRCYEAGLARDPALSGRITVRFVIDLDGTVMLAGEAEGVAEERPLPDREVAACVAARFTELVFPAPEGGVVTVVYPIRFRPGPPPDAPPPP